MTVLRNVGDKVTPIHESLSAQEFADALLADLSAWSAPKGSYTQEDDITLLIVDVGSLS